MARAYGANAQLLGRFETAWGTPPGGDWIRLPFVSCNLGSGQGLIASDVLGQGRDPGAPIRDAIKVEGDLVVPVDFRNFGHWLKLLFGAPATAGTGPYTHSFVSGAAALPSLALEIGMPEVPAFFVAAGVRADSLQIEFRRSGAANATLGCVAQGETRFAASQGGNPTALSFERFNQFQGSVSKDGAPLANVTGARLSYSNNLERIETIRSDGRIEGADPTVAALTGSVELRFADTGLIDAATAGTPVELELAWTVDAGRKLVFTAHEVHLTRPRLEISGPGGIQASFDWQGARDEGAGRMLSVTLVNDLEDYA